MCSQQSMLQPIVNLTVRYSTFLREYLNKRLQFKRPDVSSASVQRSEEVRGGDQRLTSKFACLNNRKPCDLSKFRFSTRAERLPVATRARNLGWSRSGIACRTALTLRKSISSSSCPERNTSGLPVKHQSHRSHRVWPPGSSAPKYSAKPTVVHRSLVKSSMTSRRDCTQASTSCWTCS